jgi:multisubunit Na+/H+ antiporter MnhG subunit
VIREVLSDVLLALAAVTVIASAVGVLVVRDAYARVHYVTPAAVVAPVLVALAIFVAEGLDENTGETELALVFMIIAAPFLAHATMRAIRVREAGDWRGPPKDAKAEDAKAEDAKAEDAKAEDTEDEQDEPADQRSGDASARRSR